MARSCYEEVLTKIAINLITQAHINIIFCWHNFEYKMDSMEKDRHALIEQSVSMIEQLVTMIE